MAYLSALTGSIILAMQKTGMRAEREYHNKPVKQYANTTFATVAPERLIYGKPLPQKDGTVFALTVTIRVRLYCPKELHTGMLETQCDLYLIPALLDVGLDLRKIVTDPPYFDQNTGMLCMPVHITADTLATRILIETNTESEALDP